jgi:hypothetical protein
MNTNKYFSRQNTEGVQFCVTSGEAGGLPEWGA